MIRDEELNRLMRYAQGMGISVRFKPYVPYSGVAAEWNTDGSEINIFVGKDVSKLDRILLLIHELGHHKAFVKDGRTVDEKIEEALNSEERNKKERKKILDMETEDSLHWEEIYKDTNCQFNIEKLRKEREYQLWNYEVYYETGDFPTKNQKRTKCSELTKKYRC